MPFANIYHLRRVAEASSKPCEICYKPTAAVLITADNRTDFFYVCLGHLKDRGFASPIADEREEAAKKRKEELELEVERVKKEYEDKQSKKKKEKEGKKDKEEKEDKKDDTSAGKGKEKEGEDKAKSGTIVEDSPQPEKAEDIPRVYSLHRTFYQARQNRARNAEMARRNRERLGNPSLFPSVPNSDL
ncbi:MAG: hypothetical protein M1840_006078 [Geoglossum simile]|nr:MAG: hypothetical protein M1840_006078 [Geoglossum simile]